MPAPASRSAARGGTPVPPTVGGTPVALAAVETSLSAPGGVSRTAVIPARFERLVSALELVAVVGIFLAFVWFGAGTVTRPGYVPTMRLVLPALLVFMLWVSPIHLHGDSDAERGLGTWRTFFVRSDNLASAASRLGWLALGGTAAILFLGELWNPGWFARANWRAWAVRFVFYLLSASIQSLVFVGFCLVRGKRLFAARAALPSDPWRRALVALVAGVTFGLMHAPNVTLMIFTLVFGAAVSWISLRTPNVFAAATCQAWLGLLLHRVLDLSLQVGAFYYQPDLHPIRRVVPLAERIIGNLY